MGKPARRVEECGAAGGVASLPELLDSLAVGVCSIDATARLVSANRAAQAMLVAPGGGLIGTDVHMLMGLAHGSEDTGDANSAREPCPLCTALGRGAATDIPAGVLPGALSRLACMVRPLLHDDAIVGASLLFEDMSTRHGLETELESSRRAAEAANLAKSVFLANMSHEIRTPMNAIVALSHLMLEDETDPKQLARLRRVATSAQHLLALLNDILDLSKIEAGHLRLENIDFALLEVLDMVRNQIEEKVLEKRIPFRLSVAPDVPAALHGDPLRLGQVLLNYASNAVKFTEQGSITLAVRLIGASTPASDGCIALRFEMIDTGVGFDTAAGERIFKPFEQADLSTTRQYGGTGLGLAICRRIAELMHGKVGADSTPGQGSTFWLEAEFQPARQAAVADPGQQRAPVALKGRRLLLVGQNDLESQQIQSLASQFGLRCYRTETGAQAALRAKTAAANAAAYDFIVFYGTPRDADRLCDHKTLQQLVTHSAATARIFATHLHDSAEAGGSTLRSRFDAILPLPLMASQLYETLLEVVNRAGDGADSETPETPETLRAPGPSPSSQASPSAPATASGAAEKLAAYRQTHILLVEDNPINREVVIDILGTAGLQADIATDGAEAAEKCLTVAYDLILMDVQMPVMDGLAATRVIRTLPRHAKTPIVALTANAFAEDRNRCLAAGMNDYLAKPVTPAALIDKLLHWLPHATVRQSGSAAAAPAMALAAIPGLDVEAGLVAVSGKRDRYASLLGKFVLHHAEDVRQLRVALAGGDRVLAHRIAHTLKGTSAVLGAGDLSAAARAVDELLKSDTGENESAALASALDTLETGLDALIAHLARTLQPT